MKGLRRPPFRALKGVSIDVRPGECVGLVGESGSGKTTLGRAVLGLAPVTGGSVRFRGEEIGHLSRRKRRALSDQIQVVFQDPYASLNPRMTVGEIVGEGPLVHGLSDKTKRDDLVRELLGKVGLNQSHIHRYPHEFSGGQRQRIALARALAARPRVLLLDEPFGALDAQVRAELRAWLRRLHDEIHLTTVFVTHDQDEAFEVADKVVIMNHGKVEQVGAPAEVFERPANDFVMRFLGHVNVLAAELDRGRAKVGDVSVAVDDTGERRAGHIYVRPHDFEIGREPAVDAFPARVLRVTPLSAGIKVELDTPKLGANVRADVDWERGSRLHLRDGDDVFVSLRRARVFATAA